MVLIWALAAALGGPAAGQGHVARSGDGRRAWTVCREAGAVALTEVWVDAGEGTPPRRLGTFPGWAGGLRWSDGNGRILYREEALAVGMFGAFGAGTRRVPVAPAGMWEISPSSGRVRRLPAGEAVAGIAAARGPAAFAMQASPETEAALSGLGAAFNAVVAAYGALHRWDFQGASEGYRRAAEQFETIPGRFPEAGFVPEAFEAYAQALEAEARQVRETGARRVCREHLLVIGDLLAAYARAHSGVWPADLDTLRVWAAAQYPPDGSGEVLGRLFRSPADPGRDRAISYVYRREAGEGEAAVTSPFYRGRLVELVRAGDGFRVVDREVGRAQVDSLLSAGVGLLKAGDKRAVRALEMVTRVHPGVARGYSKLGYAYLDAGDLDAAKASFERARSLDHRLAEAYNGLGLVFRARPKGLYDAIGYFQQALRWDRNYLEARFNMARVRFALQEYDARGDAERVIAMDPDYAPAYLLLGEWYDVLQEDAENAVLYYAHYVSLRPDDPEGRRRLAGAYLKVRDYDRIVQTLSDYVREHPGDVQALPILAQACVEQGRQAWAETYFNAFLRGIDPEERALYEDIRLLASKEEMEAFEKTPASEKKAFLRQFWTQRDPNLMTTANERRLEHYRRVWYARQNFSKGQQPWDRRGEVYIRFGEPDYRCRSNLMNARQSLAVQQVKERLAREIYGEAAAQVSYVGPVYPVRSLRAKLGNGPGLASRRYAQSGYPEDAREDRNLSSPGEERRREGVGARRGVTGDGRPLDFGGLEQLKTEAVGDGMGVTPVGTGLFDYHPAFQPVSAQEDASMVPWESWVYTNVANGIEITFTDERQNGVFDYAPAPMDVELPLRQLARLNRYNPRRVAELAARVTPDYYVNPLNAAPLEFYYDLADFRGGQAGKTALEVYLGVPHRVGRYVADEDRTEVVVERSVAVLNEETGEVLRRQGDLRFWGKGNLTASRGGLVPDVLRLEAPPGRYRMEVQVQDRLTGRSGRYRQAIVLENYAEEGIRLSDLELAWEVAEGAVQNKFSKGGLQVVPLPSRTFPRGRSVFVYYEIYHLERDAFGQTQYQVEYTVGRKDGMSVGSLISRMVRRLRGKKEKVAVGYEQVGAGETETAYTELDLGDCGPGRYDLKVVVTDLNSGKQAQKEALFVVAE